MNEQKTILELLESLSNDDGFTMKKFKNIRYKSGWQVATSGVETTDIMEAVNIIQNNNGNCGVWLSNGIYYIDTCKRVDTKKQALEIGRLCKQISIYGWKRNVLAYC